MMGFESDAMTPGHYGPDEAEPTEQTRQRVPAWQQRRAQRRARREQEDALAVDDILRKINSSGIDSLTGAEKRRLRRATERKRKS